MLHSKGSNSKVGEKVISPNTENVVHTFTVFTDVDESSVVFDSGLVIARSLFEWI